MRRSRPNYEPRGGERTFCRRCRCSRVIYVVEPWHACEGAGPWRRVSCRYCGDEFVEWSRLGCMHRPGVDLDCVVVKRGNGAPE